MKKGLKLALSIFTLFSLISCGKVENDSVVENTSSVSLDITKQVTSWTQEEKDDVSYYCALQVPYCTNQTVKSKQCLNIYVPKTYLNSDYSLNREGKMGNYTCANAPILYLNSCGSYLGKVPYKINDSTTYEGKQGWYYNYLKAGYVLVFAGERGRSDYDNTNNNQSLGKAPIGLSDLKAGIRYIKKNKDNFPGDTEKIISHGMSAGGAMSTLLASSGNSHEFDTYLNEMGAIMDASDDVFAAQIYCPITDLEHADQAYEFYYGKDSTNMKDYSDFSKSLSSVLADGYISYFNSLNLKVGDTTYSINEDGRSGNFIDYLKSKYSDSLNTYINDGGSVTSTISSSINSIDNIVKNIKGRSKSCPSFDALELTTNSANAENFVFGSRNSTLTSKDWCRHFSRPVLEAISSLKDEYNAEYNKYYQDYYDDVNNEEVKEQVKLYNPYTYLNSNDTTKAKKIRICVGSNDSDTAPVISACLALKFQQLGIATDYNIIWGMGHDTADVKDGLKDWIESI